MRSVLAPVLPLLGLPLLGLSLLAGCSDREVSRVEPTQDPVFDTTIPVTLNRDLDILFVVDNSGSMEAEQQQLAANFPQFINVLQQIEGGLPNLHLGILSSNVGAAGAAAVPGCAASGDDGNLLTGPPGNTCAADFGLPDRRLERELLAGRAQADDAPERTHPAARAAAAGEARERVAVRRGPMCWPRRAGRSRSRYKARRTRRCSIRAS